MFEARLAKASTLKKILDSIKELVTEANFECSSEQISLQAMDSSHVSLVSLNLNKDGFAHYRADRQISLGINLVSMSKILKCAGNDDVVTLKASDQGDNVTFMFESPKEDRISDFELKLMDIDSEHLGIPKTEYKCVVKMPSSEFQRICKEVAVIGDVVTISVSKEGIKFSVTGDMGTGNITCRPDDNDEDEAKHVVIEQEENVSLTFALRYLNFFAKATPLSSTVSLSLSPQIPLVVEYGIEDMGHVRFFLAPKIE